MKKLIIGMFAAAMCFATANAGECIWSWWTNTPAENATKNVEGCALGIGSKTKTVKGAQVSLVYSNTEKVKAGCQFSILGVNVADEVRNGPQIGWVNIADKAALQFGLVCVNKDGFLPWFIFFNFSKNCFGKIED